MDQNRNYLDERTPAQCRNGPIEDRTCTDCFCCIIYLLLIAAAVFLAVFAAGGAGDKTVEEITKELGDATYGSPLLAIVKAYVPIILALTFVIAICLLLVITTYVIPALAAYIYIPLFLMLMLFAGVLFVLRYVGIQLPVIGTDIQKDLAAKGDITTLVIGVAFLVGFLAAVVTLCTKKSKFQHIVPVLRIAKICFWSNCYLFIFSIFFCCLSLAALSANYALLSLSQTKQEPLIDRRITAAIIVLELLWTHGVMEALSDFFFESIAVHWYFKRRREENGEQSCCDSLGLTLKLMCKHFGTIVFGHVLAYVPESLNTLLGRCQRNCGCCYTVCCFCHSCTFRNLTKYSYIETILQSLPFCAANREMFGLRKRTKSMLPELYMMGNFYITLAKIFVVMAGLIICYVLIGQETPEVLANGLGLAGPLLIVFLGSLEISNHFMNTTGLIGDTLVFMYTVDVEIEKKNYGEMEPYSCPDEIKDIIREVKAGNYYVDDE